MLNKKILLLVVSALALGMGLSKVFASWSGPTANPTAANASTPINVANLSQYKGGALGVGGLFRAFSNVLIDGNLNFSASSTGAIRLNVPGKFNATQVCINGDCKTGWPAVSSSGGGGGGGGSDGETPVTGGTSYDAGTGLALAADNIFSLSINNGSTQNCPSGQKVSGLSETGIISCVADGGVVSSSGASGTAGKIAVFGSGNTLGDSVLAQSGTALYTSGAFGVGGLTKLDNDLIVKGKIYLWPANLSGGLSGGPSITSTGSNFVEVMFGNRVGALFNGNGDLSLPGINDTNGGHIRAGRLEIADGGFVTTIDDSVITTKDLNLQNPQWSVTEAEKTAPSVPTSRGQGGVWIDEWNECPTGYFISGIRFGKKDIRGLGTNASTVIKCSKL